MMTTARLHMDVTLALLASGCAIGLTLMPGMLHLSPGLVPVAQLLACAWGLVRIVVLQCTLREWRAWHANVPWTVTPAGLEQMHE